MPLVGAGLGNHVRIKTAHRNLGRSRIRDHVEFFLRVVIDIEGGRTAIAARPVQFQTVEAVNMLAGLAAVDFHARLLIHTRAAYVKRGRTGTWNLRYRGPEIATARRVL